MSNSRNIVFHRKSDFHPTRKRVGFTPQFITWPNGDNPIMNFRMLTIKMINNREFTC